MVILLSLKFGVKINVIKVKIKLKKQKKIFKVILCIHKLLDNLRCMIKFARKKMLIVFIFKTFMITNKLRYIENI